LNKSGVELIAAGLFAALFAVLLYFATGYRGLSAYVPTVASGLGLLMCVLWSIKSVRTLAAGEAKDLDLERSEAKLFILVLVVGLAYMAGFVWLGFFTSTLIMLPCAAAALGYRNWTVIALTTVVFALILYGVFRVLLSVPLPPEALLKFFGV
jgi:putative tricarboxylic transport membrane protein